MQTQVPMPVSLVAVAAARSPVFLYDLTFLVPFILLFCIFHWIIAAHSAASYDLRYGQHH
jgi:hypothetical protein